MAYEYKLNSVKNDTRARSCLFGCNTLSNVVNLFVSTFLMAYIYSFEGGVYQYIFNVGIFNAVSYLTAMIGYFVVAPLVDRSNRIWYYRASLLLRTGLVILVIFWGRQLADLLILAAILNGFCDMFYYSSYNVLKQEMVGRNNMKNYSVYSYVMSKVVDVVCPIVLGALIDATTYSQVAIIIFVVCLLQMGMSFGINSQRPKDSCFSLKKYFNKLRKDEVTYKKIKLIYISAALQCAITMSTILLNICIMFQFGSNFSLGALTSIFSAVSILTILLINRFTKAGKRGVMLSIMAFLPVIASIVIAFSINVFSIILYNLVVAVSVMVYRTVYDIYRNGTLKEAGLYSEICEHHTIVEVCMCASRTVMFGVMMVISFLHSMLAFKLLIVLISVLVAINLCLIVYYEHRFCRKNSLSNEELEEEQFKKIMKILLTKEK